MASPADVFGRFLSRDATTGEVKVDEAQANTDDWRKAYRTYQDSLGSMWLSGGSAAFREDDVGALRIVLYAEGRGETGGELRFAPAPGTRLEKEGLGPGHVLVRRATAAARSIPEAAVVFEEPLRTRRGRLARGSDLHNASTLQQLLTWGSRDRQPHLAIVLIDSDGDAGRKARVAATLQEQDVLKVIAMAVKEFEAWLIADHRAVANALGKGPDSLGSPESLAPRAAKEGLATWIAGARSNANEVRRTLAAPATSR